MTCFDVPGATHDLEQTHDVGGREEVESDDRLWALRGTRDFIDVEIRGVRRKDRALLHDAVELAEHILLHIHVLEDGLDHEVAIGEILELERRCKKRHPLVDVRSRDSSALRRALVVLAYDPEAAIERLLLHLDDRHRNAGVGEVHRDTAAHRAGADDADLLDRDRRRILRNVRNLPDLAFSEKHIALSCRLRALHELGEELVFELEALVEREIHRGFNAANVVFRGEKATELARVRLAKVRRRSRVSRALRQPCRSNHVPF